MWLSFTAIGKASSEILWQNKTKKNKTPVVKHKAFRKGAKRGEIVAGDL